MFKKRTKGLVLFCLVIHSFIYFFILCVLHLLPFFQVKQSVGVGVSNSSKPRTSLAFPPLHHEEYHQVVFVCANGCLKHPLPPPPPHPPLLAQALDKIV